MIYTFKIQCSYCGILRRAEGMVEEDIEQDEILLAHTGLMCPADESFACVDRHAEAWEKKVAAEAAPIA